MQTNNKIHILSDFLANQIAAGEVVQRPESVIKELIENSLDANANQIAIFIKDAGKSLIQIIDNGFGMSKEDLMLAPTRHATSKIFSQNDLEEIKTFGFRGEALPSISSVSLLEIKTKQKGNPAGWKLIAEPMKKDFILEEVAMEEGTQISVRNLFYNVPARRKFLKSNTTELKHINETILKFALAQPSVRFIYYNNDLLVFDAKTQTLKERINSLIGFNTTELEEPILPVNYSMNDINISGFVGHPALAKKNNSVQYFFLNGRNINSKLLSFAVFSGMEHLLEKGLKPLFVLNIKLDYKAVDVNVHPQKSEVKFEDEQLIYSIIKKSVQDALQLNKIIPELSNNNNLNTINIINEKGENENIIVNRKTGEIHSAGSANNLRYEKLVSKLGQHANPNYTQQLKKSIDLLYSNQIDSNRLPRIINDARNDILNQPCPTALDAVSPINKEMPHQARHDILNHPCPTALDAVSPINKEMPHQARYDILNHPCPTALDAVSPINKEMPCQARHDISEINNELILENLWQYHNKYILLQTETGLLAIDQHNAHERIIYEKLIADIENKTAAKQGLLFEVEIHLNSMQMLVLKEIENELKDLGFEFEIKNNTVIISSQPAEINIGAIEISFTEIIDSYNENEILELPKQERLIATISCKAAIKASKKLSFAEMQHIASNLFRCKMQYVCPHGRAIVVFFPIAEWDKKFGR